MIEYLFLYYRMTNAIMLLPSPLLQTPIHIFKEKSLIKDRTRYILHHACLRDSFVQAEEAKTTIIKRDAISFVREDPTRVKESRIYICEKMVKVYILHLFNQENEP